MANTCVFWLTELGKEHNLLVGRKCANLGEMQRIGLNVPPGFALSTDAYLEFMTSTGAAAEIEERLRDSGSRSLVLGQFADLSREVRQIFVGKQMPVGLAYKIAEYYAELGKLCGVVNPPVATRSAGATSRPGQYETYLNVSGVMQVIEHIKEVWASTFNPRSLAFRTQKGLPLGSDPIGVAVLKMVDARSAGVAFTADPNTGDPSRITIEANWGVGESVVSGTAAPDVFVVEKKNLEIQQRRLGSKPRCIIVHGAGVKEKDTPVEKRSTYCLSDEEVKNIAAQARRLEQHFGVPQDVEWAIDEDPNLTDPLFLLQSRAEVIAENKTSVDRIVDLMINRFSSGKS